jgi:hypothetical protein
MYYLPIMKRIIVKSVEFYAVFPPIAAHELKGNILYTCNTLNKTIGIEYRTEGGIIFCLV